MCHWWYLVWMMLLRNGVLLLVLASEWMSHFEHDVGRWFAFGVWTLMLRTVVDFPCCFCLCERGGFRVRAGDTEADYLICPEASTISAASEHDGEKGLVWLRYGRRGGGSIGLRLLRIKPRARLRRLGL